jgi:hypothetical protein
MEQLTLKYPYLPLTWSSELMFYARTLNKVMLHNFSFQQEQYILKITPG